MLDLTGVLTARARAHRRHEAEDLAWAAVWFARTSRAVLFDEPLTVIDPPLKWQLRSKLKACSPRARTPMIYVTHDQTEALTFADKVVVMNDGEVVQIGTPQELVRAAGAHVRRPFHRLARA